MDVHFVASVSAIVQDAAAARRLYAGALGLSLQGAEGNYQYTEHLAGVKHFGLWPLSEAAQACFGTTTWPADVRTPQASIEFEVDDVAAAADELSRHGYRLLHGARTEPWNQITARLLTPEGLLLAVCHTPWLHASDGGRTPREAFRDAVQAADAVLTSPELQHQWDDPSALPGMSTGDLAAHLVRAVGNVVTYLAEPPPAEEPISPAAYYVLVLGDDPGDFDSNDNQAVRERARRDAEVGPEHLTRRWQDAVHRAMDLLAAEAGDRRVRVAHGLVMRIDDYLATRVVELLVHADDLAVSLGLQTPQPPPAAAELAERVLIGVARQRHGDLAVLRALTRRERSSTAPLHVL